jgi:hypothetical protein
MKKWKEPNDVNDVISFATKEIMCLYSVSEIFHSPNVAINNICIVVQSKRQKWSQAIQQQQQQ